MGARRIKKCGKYATTDARFIARTEDGKSVWMEQRARDARSRIDKKEKRKENRRRNAEAMK